MMGLADRQRALRALAEEGRALHGLPGVETLARPVVPAMPAPLPVPPRENPTPTVAPPPVAPPAVPPPGQAVASPPAFQPQAVDPERPPDFTPEATDPYQVSGKQRLANALRGAFGQPTVDYEARAQQMQAKQQRMDEFQRLVQERQKAAEAKRMESQEAKARAAQLADPESTASRSLQKLHAQYLRAAGLTNDQIAQMPGSTLQQLDLDKGYGELARAKFKELEEGKKRAQEQARHERDEQAKRDYFDYTLEGKKRIAALQGGIRPGAPLTRDAQGNVVQDSTQAAIAGSIESQAQSAGLLPSDPKDDNPQQAALRARIGLLRGSYKRGRPNQKLADEIKREIDQAMKDEPAKYRIPGWVRTPDAPELSQDEIKNVRTASAGWEELKAQVTAMKDLDAKITIWQRGKSFLGWQDVATAEAIQINNDMLTALRKIANLGVPSEAEMQMVQALAPQLNDVNGLLNASAMYEGILRSKRRGIKSEMRQRGYGMEGETVSLRGATFDD